jgi:hypothetical protein
MGLYFPHLLAGKFANGESILQSTTIKLFQERKLLVVSGHDDLTTNLVRDAVLGAELDHLAITLPSEPRLQTSRFVVDP